MIFLLPLGPLSPLRPCHAQQPLVSFTASVPSAKATRELSSESKFDRGSFRPSLPVTGGKSLSWGLTFLCSPSLPPCSVPSALEVTGHLPFPKLLLHRRDTYTHARVHARTPCLCTWLALPALPLPLLPQQILLFLEESAQMTGSG